MLRNSLYIRRASFLAPSRSPRSMLSTRRSTVSFSISAISSLLSIRSAIADASRGNESDANLAQLRRDGEAPAGRRRSLADTSKARGSLAKRARGSLVRALGIGDARRPILRAGNFGWQVERAAL